MWAAAEVVRYIICSQVQDSYYGEQEARIGHFPSSIVEETHTLSPPSTEVDTTVSSQIHLEYKYT